MRLPAGILCEMCLGHLRIVYQLEFEACWNFNDCEADHPSRAVVGRWPDEYMGQCLLHKALREGLA